MEWATAKQGFGKIFPKQKETDYTVHYLYTALYFTDWQFPADVTYKLVYPESMFFTLKTRLAMYVKYQQF